jgi:hypothetical protein
MRGVIAIAALVAVTLAACNRSQPVVLDTLPVAASPASPSPDDPSSTGSVAQASTPLPQASQVECSREVAAQIVRVAQTLEASNDPCVVYWRSLEVRQHPERSIYLECKGLKAYPDPQPKGHPLSLAQCDRQLRERQARMAVPVTGMSDEEKATYRATWGK